MELVEQEMPITNYCSQTVWLSFGPIAHLALLGAFDFSDIQFRIKQAIKKPTYVFAKEEKEIYTRPFGTAWLAVHVTVCEDRRDIHEIELITTPTPGVWNDY